MTLSVEKMGCIFGNDKKNEVRQKDSLSHESVLIANEDFFSLPAFTRVVSLQCINHAITTQN